MKRFLFAVICVVLSASCNDEIDLAGRGGTYEFLESNFSGISVQDGFELYLISGNSTSTVKDTVKIESDENVINHIKYEIKNGILYFYKEQGIEFPSEVSVKISVTKDSIDALIVSSSKVQIVDTLRTNGIRLVCLDRSVLKGQLECKKMQSAVNNSTVEITGVSDTVQMNIDNGSSVKLFGLESNNAGVNVSGGSFAEITVNNEFEVTAKEKSVLHYRGTAVIRRLVSDDDSKIIKKLD
ncbi:MAG: DUF2807 domain-containing protein [Prevotellaceae bacterium]|jgi:hypothetical protein|nr:DUF2807 domain-containing protein [Prevotellaceae bacterium]